VTGQSAYIQFYNLLGLIPERAGIGRTELLTHALTGPSLALAVLSLVFLVPG